MKTISILKQWEASVKAAERAARGACRQLRGPHVPSFPKMREQHFEFGSAAPTPKVMAGYDALVLTPGDEAFEFAY